jgi:Fe2+ or Zn2+ uptake regulation protein
MIVCIVFLNICSTIIDHTFLSPPFSIHTLYYKLKNKKKTVQVFTIYSPYRLLHTFEVAAMLRIHKLNISLCDTNLTVDMT